VAQVSRRALLIVGAVLIAGVAGAVSWSLMDKRKPATAEATYTPSPPPERVTALPRGYVGPASVPALGPPLPGDLGRPILSAARARQAGEPPALPVGGLERPAVARPFPHRSIRRWRRAGGPARGDPERSLRGGVGAA
jgi:type IV secretory pathway VirB10-like protein